MTTNVPAIPDASILEQTDIGDGGYSTPAILSDYQAAKNLILICDNLAAVNGLADKFDGLQSAIGKIGKQFAQASQDHPKAVALFHTTLHRLGSLLRVIPTHQGKRNDRGAEGDPSRNQRIEEAGISERRARDALALAEIPADDFGYIIENEYPPPTLERLVERGLERRRPRPAPPPAPVRSRRKGAMMIGGAIPTIRALHKRNEITADEMDEIATLRKRDQTTLAKKGPAAVKEKAATLIEQRKQRKQEQKKRATENAEKAKEILRRIMADLSPETIRYAGENWTWEVHLYDYHLQQAIDEAYRKMKHGSAA